MCRYCADVVIEYLCKGCEEMICESCVLKGAYATCVGSEDKPGCGKRFPKQLHRGCDETEAEWGSHSQCAECQCDWCDECNNDAADGWIGFGPEFTHPQFGDTCQKLMCKSCIDKQLNSVTSVSA